MFVNNDEIDLDFEDEKHIVNGLVIGGTYVTENGQYCELVKSFSPTDNIVCYMYNQESYDEDYGNDVSVGYSEEIYYHGKLTAEDKFEIKTHHVLSNLTSEIQRLKEKRDSIYASISNVNQEYRELLKDAEKYKIIKNLIDFMENRKRFILTQKSWGNFSLYDLSINEYLVNQSDDLIKLTDYQSFELNVIVTNTAFSSNTWNTKHDKEGCYYSIKCKGVRDKTKDKESNGDRVLFFDTVDEILVFVNDEYETNRVNAENICNLYNVLGMDVPNKFKIGLHEYKLKNLESNIKHCQSNKIDYDERIANYKKLIAEEENALQLLKNS